LYGHSRHLEGPFEMVLNSYGGQQPVMPLNMAGQVLILIKDTPPVL
jgi:hypothetical protein